MNYSNLSYLIWIPLIALSVTLLAYFFQALATRRCILKECRIIERLAERIVYNTEKIAESTSGRLTIREFRQKLEARSDKRDPVLQLLIKSVGTPVDVQLSRIDSLIHRAFGGALSDSIHTIGNLAVLVALAVTSTKILWALIQMGDADPKATTAVIGHGLLSTVAGATLAALATLLNWLIVDRAVKKIHYVLTNAVELVGDAYHVHAQPVLPSDFCTLLAEESEPRSPSAAIPALADQAARGKRPVPSSFPQPAYSVNGHDNGDDHYAPL